MILIYKKMRILFKIKMLQLLLLQSRFGCKMIPTFLSYFKVHENAVLKILPLVAFAVPLLWLYLLQPGSFELMWKGRTFQLFFIWLIALELILGWESLQPQKSASPFSAKSLGLKIAVLLPTLYVVIANYLGLNAAITEVAKQNGITWWDTMALSTEYLVFAALICLIISLKFGKKGLKDFSVPIVFLGIVGAIYMIDNVFPYGQFTPFQLLVPTTATLAASALNLMGYQTSLVVSDAMPRLTATNPANHLQTATFDIAWPCAGIESLLIFTAVAALFLKRMNISLKAKIAYFAVGAAVTYGINILRIATIFTIGVTGASIDSFHSYYGPLYSIMWIVSYPLLILGSQTLWQKITNKNSSATVKPQPSQLSLA
jgi:thaumarchaeosortase